MPSHTVKVPGASRLNSVRSLSDLHRRTKISLSHLSKIYSGSRRPSIDIFFRIARAKGISADDLYLELEEIRGA